MKAENYKGYSIRPCLCDCRKHRFGMMVRWYVWPSRSENYQEDLAPHFVKKQYAKDWIDSGGPKEEWPSSNPLTRANEEV